MGVPGSQPVSKWELPFVRFLEHDGYDVSYATDVDVGRDPALLLRHRSGPGEPHLPGDGIGRGEAVRPVAEAAR